MIARARATEVFFVCQRTSTQTIWLGDEIGTTVDTAQFSFLESVPFGVRTREKVLVVRLGKHVQRHHKLKFEMVVCWYTCWHVWVPQAGSFFFFGG